MRAHLVFALVLAADLSGMGFADEALLLQLPQRRVQMMATLRAAPRSKAHRAARQPSGGVADLSANCQEEVKAMMEKQEGDEKVVKEQEDCEEKADEKTEVLHTLEDGDASSAEAAMAKLFKKCAGLSEACAKEAAPDAVLGLRMSGNGVTDECKEMFENFKPDDSTESKACQEEELQKITGDLDKGDMSKAMEHAQKGLHKCQKIDSPCDFQLAPILVEESMAIAAQSGAAGGAGQPMDEPM